MKKVLLILFIVICPVIIILLIDKNVTGRLRKVEAKIFLDRIKGYEDIIVKEARNNHFDADLGRALIWQESSGYANKKRKEDGFYSYGLCGLTLGAARDMGYSGEEKDLIKPEINIRYAFAYLRHQYNRYGDWSKALVAYNAGHFTGNYTYANSVWKKLKAIKEAKSEQ